MKDDAKTKKQLIDELSALRQQIAAQEETDAHRDRAGEALREGEEWMRVVTDSANDAIVMMNPQGSISFWNHAAEAIFGYRSDEAIGKHLHLLLAPDRYYEAYCTAFPEFRRTGSGNAIGKTLELVARRKDGREIKIALSLSAVSRHGEWHAVGIIRDITVQKRAEEALHESEEKFRILADSTPTAVMLYQDDRWIYTNRATETICGYSEEELLAMNFWDIVHPGFKPLIQERGRKRQQGEETTNRYELKIIMKDGTEKWVDLSGASTMLRGRPAGIISVMDIDDRKRAEEALRESEKKYRELIDFLPLTVFECDKEANITSVNRSAFKTFGYTQEDIDRGFNAMLIIIPADREMAEENLQGIMNGEDLGGHEYTVMRKDGGTFPALVFSAPIIHNGAPVGLRGAIIDLTGLRRAEETLREIQKQQKALLNNIPDIAWLKDKNSRFIAVNEPFGKTFGLKPEDLVGKTDLDICPQELAESYRTDDREIMKSGKRKQIEEPLIDSKGQTLWIETIKTPIYDEQGEVTGTVGIARDVTERKLFESQLRQAQKMETIGKLAGGIAHDFNNILSAVMGYTDMAIRIADDNIRLQHYLKQVFKAGERAKDLVKQILAFSRQSEERLRPLRVSPIIKEVLKLLRASLPATIEVRQDIQSDPDTVLADSTHIHQILMNLCINAAHAMPEKKGTLTVALVSERIKVGDVLIHHGLAPGMHLKLTVSDTGGGIDAGIMERIFDPFFTTKKPGEGTGMGLSVVYGIVKSYDGTITVKSEVGKGTEFSVYIPLLVETEAGERQEAKSGAAVSGGREHILLLDDEEMLVELGISMLTGLGYEVVGMTNSLEALELFRAQPERFNLVITDITMPDMTGIELTRELLRIRPDIPIIGCTGFSETITSEKAKSIGMEALIMKPIIRRRIAEAIRRALDKKE